MNSLKIACCILIILWINETSAQSTCPVVQSSLISDSVGQQQQQQLRCKCGIKIDGHIYIYCARKQLKHLPKFTRSSILYDELILSGNQIDRVQAQSFNGLKVKRLLLDDNPIQYIERNSFNELANYLEELIISVSSMNSSLRQRPQLPPNLFQNLLNLKIVKLQGLDFLYSNSEDLDEQSNGGIIRANLFNRTRKLEIINLIDCGINRIDKYSLNGVEQSLKELNLDNNQLTQVDDLFNEVERMKRLQLLVLSRNRIKRLPRYVSSDLKSPLRSDYEEFNSLQLDLSFNGINLIDEYAFGIFLSEDPNEYGLTKSIVKLNLNNNELNQFHLGFLQQLRHLKELSLDYNKIEHIPDNLFFNLRKLESLSLKGNYLTQLSSEYAFSGLHMNLKRLNLASNSIRQIGKRVFMQTTRLKELIMSGNQLGMHFDQISSSRDLLNTFEGVESELKFINLENNQLKPAHLLSLVNLLNLENIKLGNNNFMGLNLKGVVDKSNTDEADQLVRTKMIPTLNNLFEFYRNLTYLDMQNCSLRQMPYFSGAPNRTLLSFNLAQNKLCSISGINLRNYYSKLRYFNLNGNPLKCDCNLVGLRKWMDNFGTNNDAFSMTTSSVNNTGDYFRDTPANFNWKCASPSQFRNRYLSALNINEFMCMNNDEDRCLVDEDEFTMLTTTTTTTTTTSTTPSTAAEPITILPSTLSSTVKFSTSRAEEIRIIDQISPKYDSSSHLIINKTPNNLRSLQSSPTTPFLLSIELKQTLLGSFIGALSVLILVFILICIIKSTRPRLLGKDISLCHNDTTSSNDKDKSNSTTNTTMMMNTTNGAMSQYELGKLSLQTLCINSTGCSSSSSSSSASSGSGVTNTSCLCGVNDPNQTQEMPCLFTKMDPLRLTLVNTKNNTCSRTSFHQNYFISQSNPHHIQNHANLHYLSAHLPYSTSNNSSPTPIQSAASPQYLLSENKLDSSNSENQNKIISYLNSKFYLNPIQTSAANSNDLSSSTNTYDKLHQQRVITSNGSLRPMQTFIPHSNTLINSQLNNSTLQQQQGHFITNLTAAQLATCAETTPFLIITRPDMNQFVDLMELEANMKMNDQNSESNNMHTYHEIGDILVNMNKNNTSSVTNPNSKNLLNSGDCKNSNEKASEMFI